MALKVGELYAALALKPDDFNKGLDDSHKKSSSWGGKVKSIFKGAAVAIGASLVAIGVAAVAVGVKSLENAEGQELALRQLDRAYGKNAGEVQKWAEKNAISLGVEDDALQTSMAKYATFAKNAGMSSKEIVKGSEDMATRAAEIALSTGKSYDEVFNSLLKGVQGSTRGLREYGVAVDTAAITDEAMRLGLIKKGEALDVSTRAQALQSLIMQQTTGYTAQAAAMDGTYAKGKLQIGVMMDNVMDTIGAAVMTMVTAVMPTLLAAFDTFQAWVTENGPAIEAIVATVFDNVGSAIAFVGEEILPLLGKAFDFFVKNVLPVLEDALNWYVTTILPALGEAFNFITDVVIPALGDVFTWIVENILPPVQEVFKVFTDVILPALGRAFQGVQQWIKDNWPTISKIVEKVGAAVKTAFEIIANIIKTVAPVIVAIGEVVFPIVGEAAGFLLRALDEAFTAIGIIWDTAASVAKTIVDTIKKAWDPLAGFFKTLWNGITGTIKGAINGVIGAINSMIRALNQIQIHIPGFDTPVGRVGGFGWNGLNLAELPYLARGTPNFKGGWAVLGEHGPELARLPRGTQVLPASQTAAIAARGGDSGAVISIGDVNFHSQYMSASEVEARSFARQLWSYLEEEAFRRGRSLQPVRGGS